MTPTDEQNQVVEHGAGLGPGENLKVVAFAGAGKTTTLCRLAAARDQRGIYMVFNRKNADEAKRKLAMTRCNARSMHAFAFDAMRDRIGGGVASVSAGTVRDSGILNRFNFPRLKGWGEYRIASAVVRTMKEFANSADQDFTREHAAAALILSVGDPDLIKDAEARGEARHAIMALSGVLSRAAEALWIKMAEEGAYSHDMYLKHLDLDEGVLRQAFEGYRYAMVDEGQDQNPVQTSIIAKSGLPTIVVGDPYQQIYSWRGAENALDKTHGRELYLTQSFRFGENIAAIARDILAARPGGGPEQRLEGAGTGAISKHKGAQIAILCRSNSGVLMEALDAMTKGVSIHVDNMPSILSDVRSAQAIHDGRLDKVSSPDMAHYRDWEEVVMDAEDGNGTMARLVKLIEEGRTKDIEDLSRYSRDPDTAKVTVCTAHRAKGDEWPGVKLGADWKNVDSMMSRYAKAEKMSEKHKVLALEEFNALYVAATRPVARLANYKNVVYPEPEPRDEYEPMEAIEDRIAAASP